MITRTLIALALLAWLAAGCSFSFSVVTGSGNIVSEDRAVSDFDAVNIAGSGDLTLIQGETEGLTIEADDNILPHIRSDVRDGTLVIEFDRQDLDPAYLPSRPIRYILNFKNLNGLTVSGNGNVTATTLTAGQLQVTLSGAGNVNIGALEADSLTMLVSGTGDTDLAGRVGAQEVTVSGNGGYRAGDLASETARVTISGVSDATVWVTDSLDATISGAGSVRYYGRPEVSSQVSGAGAVTSLGDK